MRRGSSEQHPELRHEQAGEWCMRVADGSLDDEARAAFEAWLASDPENRTAFDKAILVWQAMEAGSESPTLLDVRLDALESLRRGQQRRWARRLSAGWQRRAALAASLLILLGVGLLLVLADQSQSFETGIGERRVVTLDDGSRISLDAASRVEVDYEDDRRALVLVAGRAKFDVAKDPLRPFSVTAGGKTVVATGTSFSVELVSHQVRVVLYEGRVDVLAPAGEQLRLAQTGKPVEQELTPGRELVTEAEQNPARVEAVVAPVDPVRSSAWEAGQLFFTDEPLARVVERLNRYSRERLVVTDAAAASLPISGVFSAGDTQAFVQGLSGVFPVHVARRDGRIELSSRTPS